MGDYMPAPPLPLTDRQALDLALAFLAQTKVRSYMRIRYTRAVAEYLDDVLHVACSVVEQAREQRQ
jgi:hypothetical protein